MNTLTRWEPVKDLEDLQNHLSRLFGRAPVRRTEGKEQITLPEWAPLADITEDDREYSIKIELPEVKKEEVKVTVENGVLTISGERRFEKEEKNKKYHRIERTYGSFVRSFGLPDDAAESEQHCRNNPRQRSRDEYAQGRLKPICPQCIGSFLETARHIAKRVFGESKNGGHSHQREHRDGCK